MSEVQLWMVWSIGVMFTFGFCPINRERYRWIDFLMYIAMTAVAWPLSIGMTLRQVIESE